MRKLLRGIWPLLLAFVITVSHAAGLNLSNNASSTLASGISDSATSLTLAAGDGNLKFPSLSAGEYFYAYLIKSDNTYEIVKVTARSGDVLTITRAQQGTSALTFSTGDVVSARLTAADINAFPVPEDIQNSAYTYTDTVGGTADAITLTPSPAWTAYTEGQQIWWVTSGANTTSVTVNVSSLGAKSLTKNGATALAAGDLPSGALVGAMYDGTQFQLLGPKDVTELADDASPQLAADLDGQGNNIDDLGVLFMSEQAEADADVAGDGQWWVDTATPNVPMFTDDAGTDHRLGGIGKQTIWIPASAMTPTVSNGSAALTSVETTAGRPDMNVLDFDASSDEHAQFDIAPPKSWNEGTVTYQVYWTSTATDTDGVTWSLQCVSVSDGDTIDVAYGTAVTVDDANQSTAEDLYVTAESGAVTCAGSPAEGDELFFRIFRDVSDANDTAAEDARLLGANVFFTTDTGTDD